MPSVAALEVFICVCFGVLFCGGWAKFLREKKTAKKEALCVEGGFGCCEQPKRMLRALGQTYVRQLMPFAPPRFTLFGLVAVAVLADTVV